MVGPAKGESAVFRNRRLKAEVLIPESFLDYRGVEGLGVSGEERAGTRLVAMGRSRRPRGGVSRPRVLLRSFFRSPALSLPRFLAGTDGGGENKGSLSKCWSSTDIIKSVTRESGNSRLPCRLLHAARGAFRSSAASGVPDLMGRVRRCVRTVKLFLKNEVEFDLDLQNVCMEVTFQKPQLQKLLIE